MENDKQQNQDKLTANNAEHKKQIQDFPNMPASAEKQNPPDIEKQDIKKSSDLAETGKTDNTESQA